MSTGKTGAELLADFVYRTGYDDLPDEAITMSRKMVLDQLGDQLASSTLDWNKKVLKYVEDLANTSDQSTIVSYGVRSAAEYAAFSNATFTGFATRVLPEEQASRIATTVSNLEQVKDLRDLTDLLVSPRAEPFHPALQKVGSPRGTAPRAPRSVRNCLPAEPQGKA